MIEGTSENQINYKNAVREGQLSFKPEYRPNHQPIINQYGCLNYSNTNEFFDH